MLNTADQKLETLTNRYQLVKTADIVSQLEAKGYVVDSFKANKVRKQSKQGYQKHTVRLSNETTLQKVGDTRLQLVLINSHDGTTPLKLSLGFFRLVCSNGAVVGETFESYTIKHIGKSVPAQVEEALERIVAQAEKLRNVITAMQNVQMTSVDIRELEQKAVEMRASKLSNSERVLEGFTMPVIKRQEDESNDLYTVFQRTQEALIRGGIVVSLKDVATGHIKTRKLAAVRSITADESINSNLFDLALNYLQIAA
jgi:hypothetical protein